MSYMGFKKLKEVLANKGAKNPGALAVSIGRKKYGREAMKKAAAEHKSLKETKK